MKPLEIKGGKRSTVRYTCNYFVWESDQFGISRTSTSNNRGAAVDHDRLPGDVPTRVRCEQHRRPHQVGLATELAEGRLAQELLAVFLERDGGHLRREVTRRQRVDANVLRPPLCRERASHIHDR